MYISSAQKMVKIVQTCGCVNIFLKPGGFQLFFFEIFILQSVGYLKYNLKEIVELMMQLA